jgi:hypothetical protein
LAQLQTPTGLGRSFNHDLRGTVDTAGPPSGATPLRARLAPPAVPSGTPPQPTEPGGVPHQHIDIEPYDPLGFGSPRFAPLVRGCFDRYWATGGRTEELMRLLSEDEPRGIRIRIQETTDVLDDQNRTRPDDPDAGFLRPGPSRGPVAGVRGPGTGSTIDLNLAEIAVLAQSEGMSADDAVCIVLLHELVHAIDYMLGIADAAIEHLADGDITVRELKACTEENFYRLHATPPFTARLRYGTTTHTLPPDVVNGTRVFPVPGLH